MFGLFGRRRAGPITSIFIGVIFIITGYLVFVKFGRPGLEEAKASQEWPSVQGTIERSQVVRKRRGSNKKTTYSADVIYRYSVAGESFESNQVRFGGDVSSSSSKHAYKTTGLYPKGKRVTVYYNPKEPSAAVLEAGSNFSTKALYYGALLFLGAGVLAVLSPLLKLLALFFGLGFAAFKK